MNKFSRSSQERLDTCHPWLRELFKEVLVHFNCKVLEGHRPKELQDAYFREGKSKLRWPDSTHNEDPSQGIDVAPWPIDWKDIPRFYYFAGHVKMLAALRGMKIRWGGDWDDDTLTAEERFKDLVHFELAEV